MEPRASDSLPSGAELGQQGENFIKYEFPECLGETSRLCVLHGFQMGDIVQEAKDQWYDAQPALDCEQQLKCGFAFCRGDCPWPASGLGWGSQDMPPSPGPVPWLPLCSLKETLCLVCKLQCRSKQRKISLAFQLGGVIKYLFAKKGQNRPHLFNTLANFLQITFSWGYLLSAV